ncbi:Ig-like domain-containing protein [Herpetosiphon llansteffanensis]|uniref:Ig-like domain-containing protein n=1 Tax=Herpetosiphon llansteffanensis TaxID=2094568 RepID=UPI000D7C8E96|nr:Ig-like domain-containing protein [Herpetosiphon llansteffanensis]
MSKLSKITIFFTIVGLILGLIHQPIAPVAAVEPQQPHNPGTWSAAFASSLKTNYGYIPGRPIEWNGTLYANILSLAYSASDAGVGYWNGQQWLKIDGLTGLVDSVVVHQNKLYAAGKFSLDGKHFNIAYWDGNLWTALPYQFNNNTFLNLVSHENQLYVGGGNLVIDGQAISLLARWDGTQWHDAAEGIEGIVFSLLSTPNGLYLGGAFGLNGQGTSLIHWNGSQWQRVGGGLRGLVMDLEWANSQIYVSGQFTSTLQPAVHNIAAWNGTTWNTFGTGIVSATHNLALVDDQVYALSKSLNYPNPAQFQLHRWDATHWTTLSTMQQESLNGSWLHYPDAVLLNYNQELFAFGALRAVQAIPNSNQYTWSDWALRWDGEYWLSMTPSGLISSGNEGPSVVLTTDNEDLYALANKMHWNIAWATLAHLNPQNQWQSLVEYTYQPALGNPQALQKYQQSFFSIYDNRLYQAGNNTWNAASNNYVSSLAQANNLLYVAGGFEQFNGVTAHNLVTWNGTQWQALNTPAAFDQVAIVEAHGNSVYISDGSQLARWDGVQWTTLAPNVTNISEIEPTADGVYIAGTFSSVAGVSAPKIAYWNGSTWSGLSGVIDGSISDLEMGADGLYVAGNFRGLTNGIVSNGILRWDGAAWHGLAGGVQANLVSMHPGVVYSLAATPTRILMHGKFLRVGNEYESYNIAAWEYGNEPLIKAKPDYAITYRPQPVTVNVLANDWSDQPSTLQLVSVTTPSNGTAVISGNQIVYRPYPQFTGLDTLTYTVRDPINAVTTTAQVRLHVWNNPSVVLHDVYLPAVIR